MTNTNAQHAKATDVAALQTDIKHLSESLERMEK